MVGVFGPARRDPPAFCSHEGAPVVGEGARPRRTRLIGGAPGPSFTCAMAHVSKSSGVHGQRRSSRYVRRVRVDCGRDACDMRERGMLARSHLRAPSCGSASRSRDTARCVLRGAKPRQVLNNPGKHASSTNRVRRSGAP